MILRKEVFQSSLFCSVFLTASFQFFNLLATSCAAFLMKTILHLQLITQIYSLSYWAWFVHWLTSNNCSLWDSSSRCNSNNAYSWIPCGTQSSIIFWVILAYTCVKPLVRLYVCQRVGPFWVHFGSILGPFREHTEYCLNIDASFRVQGLGFESEFRPESVFRREY